MSPVVSTLQHHGMQLMHRDPFGMGMSPFGGMSLFGPMSMSPFDSMFQQSLLVSECNNYVCASCNLADFFT